MRRYLIILDHNFGGRLANQLWNFISIFAYGLESGRPVENYSFFSYKKYFNIPQPKGIIPFFFYTSLIPEKIRFRIHRRYVRFLKENKPELILDSGDKKPVYLLPSDNGQHVGIENTAYTTGWLFRNPIGIEKYRKEIVDYFKPREEVTKTAEDIIKSLRNQFKEVVGVHIRQTDYSLVGTGEYFFSPKEVTKLLGGYLIGASKKAEDVTFVICSDGELYQNTFAGLNVYICRGNVAEDLFTLALTDRIIGSNSTYGAFAAYYGNIPIICFKREPMHWLDFAQKTSFEYYNDATMVQQ